jgi:nitrogen regulatory protein P-II 1
MKEIKAIIQPFMLEKVLDALHQRPGTPGCIVSRVEAHGKAPTDANHPATEMTEKVKLEIVVADAHVESIVELIQRHAHSGNKGDGKVFVMECVNAVAIRTSERGEKAL